MPDHRTRQRSKGPAAERNDRTVVAAAAAMAFAVVCCAGGPALLALLGSFALGTVVGWAAGAAAFLAGVGALAFVMRGRRGSSSPATPKQVPR